MRTSRLRLLWASAVASVVIGILVPLTIWAGTIVDAGGCTPGGSPGATLTIACSETAAIADTLGLGLPKSETVSVADTLGLGVPTSETATVVESAQSAASAGRSETATVVETAQSAGVLGKSETASIAESAQRAAVTRLSRALETRPLTTTAAPAPAITIGLAKLRAISARAPR